MRIHLLLILIGFCASAQTTQNYRTRAVANESDYHTIVRETRSAFNAKDLSVTKNKKAKKQFERWALYWQNRINPDGSFPDENTGYYNAGILDTNGKIVAQDNNPYVRATTNIQTWTNVGPKQSDMNNNGYSNYPQMGRLNAFLRIKHPSDTNQDVLFVGAPNGGVWKSTNGGQSWTPKLDNVAGIGVTDIATAPGTDFSNYTSKPIYVSTGDYDGEHAKSIGVLKSTDGGETFSSTGLSYAINQKKYLGDLVVVDDNTVFVGADKIMKTTDGGTTWAVAYDPGYPNLKIGRAATNGNEVMYTGSTNDVYYTSDYTDDNNWTTIVSPSGDYGGKAAVTVDDNGDFYIQKYVGVADGSPPHADTGKVKKFDKSTNSFSDVGNPPPHYEPQGGYNQALVVTNDIILSGEFNGQSSTDNGSSWTRTLNGYWNANATDPITGSGSPSNVGTYIHSDHHRMGKRDGALDFWSVNDGGLNYITYPTASSTTPNISYLSGDVQVTQSYTIAINPSANDGALMMANQDNDAYSKHNGTWYAVAQGDGIQSAIDYNNAAIRYAGNHIGIVGQTTTGFNGELNGNSKWAKVPGARFYFPMEIHKTKPNIIYAGGDDVYKHDFSALVGFGLGISPLDVSTRNNPPTISSDATSIGLGTIKTIATHGNAVLAADVRSIKLSTDEAGTWTTVTAPGGVVNITSVDFVSTVTNIMYVTEGGYVATNKVFKSTDGGSSWTNITGNLPNIVVNEVMVKQNNPMGEILFVATELGVYYTTSTNGASTNWTRLGSGLPNVDVKDIEIHYTADKLVAGTFGRGAWEINIANATLSTSDVFKQAEGISVYPNPANQRVHITTPEGDYNYVMYNVVGGVVKQGVVGEPINVADLAPNMYILRVFNDTSSFSEKIIIE